MFPEAERHLVETPGRHAKANNSATNFDQRQTFGKFLPS